jgi:hypothetical protein
MFGRLGVDKTELTGVGADLRSALIGSVDADIRNFSIGFFGAEETSVAFEDLVLQHLNGTLKDPGSETYDPKTSTADPGADTIVSRLKRAGFALNWSKWTNDPKAHLHGFKYSTKTGATLEELDISGLRYDDPDRGLTLDIAKAVLPTGKDGKPALEYTSNGKLIIPTAEIDQAAFDIADVLKIGGNGKSDSKPGNGLSYAPDLSVVDMLSGHVNFTVESFVRSGVSAGQTFAGLGVFLAGPFKIRVNILDGKINYHEVEDQSTGYLADAAVDIDFYRGAVDWDTNPPHIGPARLSLDIIGADPYWWDLDEKEEPLAATGFVNVSTFIKHPPQSKPSTGARAKGSFLSSFFFGDVDIHLELPGKGKVKLGNAGSLTLGGGSSPGFVIELTSSGVPAIEAAVPTFTANVASLDLKLDTAGTTLKTGSIKIDGVTDTMIHFVKEGVGGDYTDDDGKVTRNELPVPKDISGTITRATVENIELQTVSDKKSGK